MANLRSLRFRSTPATPLILALPIVASAFALGAGPMLRARRAERDLEVARSERDEARGLMQRVERLEAIITGLKLDEAASLASGPGDGHLLMGDLLICWGRAELEIPSGAPHVRSFRFVFPIEFADPPAVTTGFHLQSSGHVFGVFRSILTSAEFSGGAFNNKSGPDDKEQPAIAVTMSYVAIGRPKPPGPRSGDSGPR